MKLPTLDRWLVTKPTTETCWGLRRFHERRASERAERTRRDEAVGSARPPFWHKPLEETLWPTNLREV